MNCRRLADLMPELVENELDELTTRQAREHIARCPECARELAEYEKAIAALRCAWEMVEVPQALAVLDLPAPRRASNSWLRPVYVAGALLAVLVLVTVLPVAMKAPSENAVTVKRALAPNRVASNTERSVQTKPAEPAEDVVKSDVIQPAGPGAASSSTKTAAKPATNQRTRVAGPVRRLSKGMKTTAKNERREYFEVGIVPAARDDGSRADATVSSVLDENQQQETEARVARAETPEPGIICPAVVHNAPPEVAPASKGGYALRQINEAEVRCTGTGVKQVFLRPTYGREYLASAARL